MGSVNCGYKLITLMNDNYRPRASYGTPEAGLKMWLACGGVRLLWRRATGIERVIVLFQHQMSIET
jgi:hypothetical protein